ncbi:hypothetical protein CPT_Moonbeam27 [Bacillus phage Moonbeam]|uniref:Uncharacterized protein n=1 Tax=Bacillus phage Moonbeam TaxID=1540091 RepID=A0A0A0RMY0_9CAUD|nr:hypothetical protein CPT_Moonbeam27 [Bacillus phage Moonbeam]AIW03425.1 hypothetical protein CPT_Moonbeam27 [Bacillus phage Moonbeam]
MSLDKSHGIYRQFKQVKAQIENINDLYGTAKELGQLTGEDMKFTQTAYDLLNDVKEFVKLIEESDTNLDPATTKLEGVDKFFEGHEASKYVNEAINEVYNNQNIYGDNEIRDELFEGLCWCQFKAKLKRMNLTVDTAPISAYMLSSIEATKDVEGKCFHCGKDTTRPCSELCTNPCPCFDK